MPCEDEPHFAGITDTSRKAAGQRENDFAQDKNGNSVKYVTEEAI